jgi:hypothetical protein
MKAEAQAAKEAAEAKQVALQLQLQQQQLAAARQSMEARAAAAAKADLHRRVAEAQKKLFRPPPRFDLLPSNSSLHVQAKDAQGRSSQCILTTSTLWSQT